MDEERYWFYYRCRKFPKLSLKKLIGGIFNYPQIRQLIKDTDFIKVMTEAWKSFFVNSRKFRIMADYCCFLKRDCQLEI